MPYTRILTAIILITVVVTGVLFLPTFWVGLLLATALLSGIREWVRLAGFAQRSSHLVVLYISTIIMLAILWLIINNLVPMLTILTIAALWWFTVSWRIWQIEKTGNLIIKKDKSIFVAIGGILILFVTWSSMVWLHQQAHGPWLLLFFFVLVWTADTGAYFAGRRWGNQRLAPILSPNKTLAGMYGAFVGAAIWGGLLAILYGNNITDQAALMLLCIFTVAISIVGDLYESLLKRERCLKDSGAMLPGHGGVLDRIDSLTSAAPIFVLGLTLLGKFA